MKLNPAPPLLPAVIRMLASPHDGEILAAVHALRRVLAADGSDMNDFADLISRGVPKAEERQSYRQQNSYSWAGIFPWADDALRAELKLIHGLAEAGSLMFTAWEREFICDVADRAEITPRQADFLMKAHAKWLRANQSF